MEDKGRVESLQSHCATLLKRGESWDYIGGSLQLMAADKRAQREEQGLLDFGEDFMKSLDNAARYIEKVLKGLKDAIGDQKAVKRLASGRRGENVRRGGNRVEVSRRAPEIVRALEEERARWELVGSYPDLQAEAYMWDGETEPQHAERIIERVEGEVVTNDAAEVATNEAMEGQGAFDFSASVEEGEEDVPWTMDDVPWRSSRADARGEGDFSAAVRGVFEVDANEARDFAQRVQEVFAAEEKPKKGFVFKLCTYPEVMKLIFPWEGDVVIRWDNLEKLQSKHGMTPEQIGKLPGELCDPIAIFEDNTRERDYVVVTELEAPARDGKARKVAAILKLRGKKPGVIDVTFVSSAYARAKDDTKYAGLLKNNRLRYLDKARAGEWASLEETFTSQLLTTKLAEPGSGVMLKEDVEDVKGDVSFSVIGGVSGKFAETDTEGMR